MDEKPVNFNDIKEIAMQFKSYFTGLRPTIK